MCSSRYVLSNACSYFPAAPAILNNVPDLFQARNLSVSHMNTPFLKFQRKRILLAATIVQLPYLIEIFLVACQGKTGGLSSPVDC